MSGGRIGICCTYAFVLLVSFLFPSARCGCIDATCGIPPVDDWHYPREEEEEFRMLQQQGLLVTNLTGVTNTSGRLTVQVGTATVNFSEVGEIQSGWELSAFLAMPGMDNMAVLTHNAERWGYILFVKTGTRLNSTGLAGGRGFRKGFGHLKAIRRPRYNLTDTEPRYFERAASDPSDFVKQSMQAASKFGETTFEAAAARLVPPHDYALVGNVKSHTKFVIAPDGRVRLANFSVFSSMLVGNDPTPANPGQLLFDPRAYVHWWPEHNFSDYKAALVGRYSRALVLGAYDQVAQAGFVMMAVPNTHRGVRKAPYDTAELLIELKEEGGKAAMRKARYYAVEGCVLASSPIGRLAINGSVCHPMHGCKPLVLCRDQHAGTVTELHKPEAAAYFYAHLLGHCSDWQDLFTGGGMQLALHYDKSEGARLVDMSHGVIASAMTTWVGARPNYGSGTNYWSVTQKDRGSLPLTSFALDHALLLWGYTDEAGERIAWYLEHYVRASNGFTPRQLQPESNWTQSSVGMPGSIDLKHWEDQSIFGDSMADYGRWLDLWVDAARLKEASGDQAWIQQTWPQVKLMATYMQTLMRANVSASGLGKGLIIGPAEHDTSLSYKTWFSINGWTWRGFVQLSRLLRDTAAIDEAALAMQLATEAAAFKAYLDAAKDASVVTDAAGHPFFVPPYPAANFTPYTKMTEFEPLSAGGGASYANFRYYSEMLAAEFMGTEIDISLQDFRESHSGTLSGMTRFWDHLDDMPAAGYAYAAVATDRLPSFNSLLFGHIANYQSRGTFNAPEQLSLYGDGADHSQWTYSDSYRAMLSNSSEIDVDACVPSTMLVALMVRWLLVFEARDTDTLWLLKMAPRRMYAEESHASGDRGILAVTNAPTRFGNISFSVDRAQPQPPANVSALYLRAHVTLVMHQHGFVGSEGLELVIRLRDPKGHRMLKHVDVETEGRGIHGKIDAAKESVHVMLPRPDFPLMKAHSGRVKEVTCIFTVTARLDDTR